MKCVSFLALLALASCATVPGAGAGPSAPLGGMAEVDGIKVRPLELLEDSRCPAEVQCIWAGQVRISVEIIVARGRETREMTLGQPIMLSGGTLTLVDVQPPKLAPESTDPRAYRFTFAALTLPRP